MLGGSWTWTLAVTNASGASSAPAIFASGNVILRDNLPNANISYGLADRLESDGSGITGTIELHHREQRSHLTAGGGTVTIAPGGSFEVGFAATASAGGRTRIRARVPAASCAVDPDSNVVETNEGNNTCNNNVTVAAPDLTVTKTNSVSGTTTPGAPWTWTLTVSNSNAVGSRARDFDSADVILRDNLPNTNISYSTATRLQRG